MVGFTIDEEGGFLEFLVSWTGTECDDYSPFGIATSNPRHYLDGDGIDIRIAGLVVITVQGRFDAADSAAGTVEVSSSSGCGPPLTVDWSATRTEAAIPLDEWVDACVDGDDVACDLALLLSPEGSPEEQVALDCGGRGQPASGAGCSYDPATSDADEYGDHPLLDALSDLCVTVGLRVCNMLYLICPGGSEYEEYATQVPGESLGDTILRGDTLGWIAMYEDVRGPNCETTFISNVEVVDLIMVGDEVEYWTERWHVDRCGEHASYTMTYTPSDDGGVDMMVHPDE
jgi:hypothetical protein